MDGTNPGDPILRALARRLTADNEDLRKRIAARDEFAGAAAPAPARKPVERLWSPFPVLGYRAWRMYRNGLRGSRTWWHTPSHAAVCRFEPTTPGEVPHDDGRCGRLGCGIYALRSATDIAGVLGRSHGATAVVLGAVAMTGKVVEHDDGYRAARAEVVAAVAIHRMQPMASTESGWIRRLFLDPIAAVGETDNDLDSNPYDYLETSAERYTRRWTSVNRSE